MKILAIHADFIEVEPKQKAIKNAEEIKPEKKRYEEVLVVFSSVEKQDENGLKVVESTALEIDKIAKQIKVQNILIYPLVHLTQTPSNPQIAEQILKDLTKTIQEFGYRTNRTPFGWYKAYTLKCKGHPLSELSREIKTIPEKKEPEEIVSKSLQAEEKMKSKFFIMDKDGKLYETNKFDYKNHKQLKKFAEYETKKLRVYEKELPHIKLMKSHSLVNYEPGSDPGNFRWLPKGRLIKKILERAISNFCIDYGAEEVETPIMYDFEHNALKKYLNRFPARQYIVLSEDKRLFLRFSACFGQFLVAHDMVVSYKHLPAKMYELTRYSFRREQAGELAGLKRLRTFTMPDMHTLTKDIEQAKQEFQNQLEKGLEWNSWVGLDELEVGFRAQTEFFNKNKEWYVAMVKKLNKPVLLELYDERYAYFITKFEFNFVDNLDKASALTTVQIDVENAEIFDISYVDEQGQKQRPYILHASFSGSLERVLYALLEKEALRIEQGKKGRFPLWLAPIQLRIIPIGKNHLAFAKELQKKAQDKNVRADIDDSNETLRKKIMNAEMEWCSYICVVGDKEIKSNTLMTTIRESEEKKQMKLEDLINEIHAKTIGKPFEPISFGKTTTSRPII